MELGIKKKWALVCGASQGLGFATAQSLAKEGCNLILCSRSEDKLTKAADILSKEFGVEAKVVASDLTTASGRKTLLDFMDQNEQVDILVNNIGGPPPSLASDTSIEQWQKGFEHLFASAVEITQKVLPAMVASQFGRIVTITSISVVEPIQNLVVSTSMRSALTGFFKTLATEVAESGVTVNTVMPGIIHTERINYLRSVKAEKEGTSLEQEMAKTIASIPAKRMGKPEELGDLIAFLASERASYLTGQNFCVDGGLRRSW